MRKFSFEDLHANHKWAFADGFLCGIVFTIIGYQFYRDYRDERDLELKYRLISERTPDNTTD